MKRICLRRSLTRLALACLTGLGALPALAGSHALILAIDDYDNAAFKVPENVGRRDSPDLPGVRVDVRAFRQMAELMGVPPANIRELRNQQLTRAGLQQAMQDLVARTQTGDKVVLFYSGHGSQIRGKAQDICSEGILTHDAQLYLDVQLRRDLDQLSTRASQIIFFNDSCFSGGQISSSRQEATSRQASPSSQDPDRVAAGQDEDRPRAYPYPTEFRPLTTDVAGYRCGQAINQSRSASVTDANRAGSRLLYVAAAAETEVAWESAAGGGRATAAMLRCLTDRSADADNSGSISGQELAECAQRRIDPSFVNRPLDRQRITLTGDRNLPLVSLAVAQPDQAVAVNPAGAFRDIVAQADPTQAVALTAGNTNLRLGQDFLNLTVRAARAGYLYLLHVGPDNKTINQLFPNQFDRNNRIEAGRDYPLPRSGWGIKATGPAGQHHVIAVVSEQPRDFSVGARMTTDGAFARTELTAQSAYRLSVVAVADRFGASQVLTINEAP